MKKLLASLVIATMLLQICAAVPVLAADPEASGLSVHFDVIAVSPVSVTIRAEFISQVDRRIDYTLYVDDAPVRYCNVTRVTTSVIDVEKPIYGEVELSDKERVEMGTAAAAWAGLVMPLSAKTDKEKLDFLKANKISVPTKDIRQTGVEILHKVVEDKADFARYEKLDKAASGFDVRAGELVTLDFQINTGASRNRGLYGSAGVLKLEIDGKLYFDMTNSSWWDTGWLYSRELTFDNTASAENLINFPVLVKLTDGVNIDYASCQADGGDLRFIDADGTTECDYEIELWDTGGDSFVWVEVPQINAGVDTDYITMYWGAPGVADGWNVAGTWNANYVAVYHMNDATTSTILDSTSNGYDGVKTAANEPIQAAGQIGYGQDFDGVNDYLYSSNTLGISGNDARTFEFIAYTNTNPDPVTNGDGVLGYGDSGAKEYFQVVLNDAINPRTWYLWGSGYDYDTAATVVLNTPEYHGIRYDGTDVHWYRDSIELGAGADLSLLNTTDSLLWIGRCRYIPHFFNGYYDGIIDEIRISNIARSADWLEATYLSNTDAFIDYGAQEGIAVVVTDAPADLGYQFQIGHGLRLNGTLSSIGSEASVQVYFQYGTTPALGASTTPFTITAPGTFAGQLTGLDHGTIYVRAVADGALATVYGVTQSIELSGSGIINILPFMLIVAVVGLWGGAIYTRNSGLFLAAIVGTVIVLALLPFVINVLK